MLLTYGTKIFIHLSFSLLHNHHHGYFKCPWCFLCWGKQSALRQSCSLLVCWLCFSASCLTLDIRLSGMRVRSSNIMAVFLSNAYGSINRRIKCLVSHVKINFHSIIISISGSTLQGGNKKKWPRIKFCEYLFIAHANFYWGAAMCFLHVCIWWPTQSQSP